MAVAASDRVRGGLESSVTSIGRGAVGQSVMVFAKILQEARRRVPLVSVEPLPWPGEPDPPLKEQCVHVGILTQSTIPGVGAKFRRARVRSATSPFVSARALRSAHFATYLRESRAREDRVQCLAGE